MTTLLYNINIVVKLNKFSYLYKYIASRTSVNKY